jgi:ABC-type lipoprotein release transport system permease subunit
MSHTVAQRTGEIAVRCDGVVAPLDFWVLLTVPAALFGIASLASFVPARKAARIDPVELLRCQ